jgi:hypothetical protein
MSHSICVMASDGLLEFQESDIREVSFEDDGIHVTLKTGLGLLLVGHEAAKFVENLASGVPPR